MVLAVEWSTGSSDAHAHAPPAADDHAVPTAGDREHSAADDIANSTADGHASPDAVDRPDSAEDALEALGCADDEELLQLAMAVSASTTMAATSTASAPAVHLNTHGLVNGASVNAHARLSDFTTKVAPSSTFTPDS
jgi:hypothetical protein